jgi:peptide/nickel transport system permease protein
MLTFIIRRLLAGIVLVFVIATLTFFLSYGSSADVARNILGESATAEQITAKNAELGLDQPLLVQYLAWLLPAARGDFGASWFSNESVTQMIANRFPVTLSMVVVAIVVTAVISLIFGVVAAVRGGWVDRVLQFVSVAGFAIPNFWLALMLVILLALTLTVLPATGYVPLEDGPGAWAMSLVLPVTSLVVGGVASAAQQIRGAFIDVLDLDYVRTLQARGLGRRSVLLALIVLSLQFIAQLGGAVVIEKIFALPGLGTLTVNSAIQGDTPALMGVVVVLVVVVVIVNLLIDLVNGWINPKVRLQ